MTPEEIQENNELIAVFIGMTKGKNNDPRWKDCWFDDTIVINGFKNKMLYFNNDWNWLMPVYTKINKYITERCFTDFKFATDTEQLHLNLWISLEDYSDTPLPLWKNIVEYIKWYNKQPK